MGSQVASQIFNQLQLGFFSHSGGRTTTSIVILSRSPFGICNSRKTPDTECHEVGDCWQLWQLHTDWLTPCHNCSEQYRWSKWSTALACPGCIGNAVSWGSCIIRKCKALLSGSYKLFYIISSHSLLCIPLLQLPSSHSVYKSLPVSSLVVARLHMLPPRDINWNDGTEWVGCLPTDAIVLVDSKALEPPAKYFSIFHPPLSGRSPGHLVKASAIGYIMAVNRLTPSDIRLTIVTIVPVFNTDVSLSDMSPCSDDQ